MSLNLATFGLGASLFSQSFWRHIVITPFFALKTHDDTVGDWIGLVCLALSLAVVARFSCLAGLLTRMGIPVTKDSAAWGRRVFYAWRLGLFGSWLGALLFVRTIDDEKIRADYISLMMPILANSMALCFKHHSISLPTPGTLLAHQATGMLAGAAMMVSATSAVALCTAEHIVENKARNLIIAVSVSPIVFFAACYFHCKRLEPSKDHGFRWFANGIGHTAVPVGLLMMVALGEVMQYPRTMWSCMGLTVISALLFTYSSMRRCDETVQSMCHRPVNGLHVCCQALQRLSSCCRKDREGADADGVGVDMTAMGGAAGAALLQADSLGKMQLAPSPVTDPALDLAV